MLKLYFVYNGHRRLFIGKYNNVDDLIEDMMDHQWTHSGITRPHFVKHINKMRTLYKKKREFLVNTIKMYSSKILDKEIY